MEGHLEDLLQPEPPCCHCDGQQKALSAEAAAAQSQQDTHTIHSRILDIPSRGRQVVPNMLPEMVADTLSCWIFSIEKSFYQQQRVKSRFGQWCT